MSADRFGQCEVSFKYADSAGRARGSRVSLAGTQHGHPARGPNQEPTGIKRAQNQEPQPEMRRNRGPSIFSNDLIEGHGQERVGHHVAIAVPGCWVICSSHAPNQKSPMSSHAAMSSEVDSMTRFLALSSESDNMCSGG